MWYAGTIWANMMYFDKYDLKVPTNYNELLAVTRVLRSNGEFPLLMGAKDDWINLDMFINIVMDINGQKFFDAVEGKSSFTDPVIIQAFTIWKSLFDTGIFQDGALGVNVYSDTASIFQEEKLAPMIFNGPWVVNGVDAFGLGSVYDVFTIDWNNDGKPAPVAPTVDVVMAINKATKYPEETWQFYSWFVSEGIKAIIDYSFYDLPALTDHVLDNSNYSAEMQKDLKKVLDISRSAAFYREISYPRLKQTLADQLKAVALGESTPQRAAEIVEAASKAEKR
jgi:ABC-type glycerol-3-phosphate transport system substrate-binding protein